MTSVHNSDWIEFDFTKNQTEGETTDLMQKQFASWEFLMCRNMQSVSFPTQLNSHNSARRRKKIKHSKSSATVITTKMNVMEKLNQLWRLLGLLRKIWEKQHTYGWHDNIYRTNVDKRSNKNWNTHERTLLTAEIAEKVLAGKTKRNQKPQGYYDQTAKDLNEVMPGNTVIVKPN